MWRLKMSLRPSLYLSSFLFAILMLFDSLSVLAEDMELAHGTQASSFKMMFQTPRIPEDMPWAVKADNEVVEGQELTEEQAAFEAKIKNAFPMIYQAVRGQEVSHSFLNEENMIAAGEYRKQRGAQADYEYAYVEKLYDLRYDEAAGRAYAKILGFIVNKHPTEPGYYNSEAVTWELLFLKNAEGQYHITNFQTRSVPQSLMGFVANLGSPIFEFTPEVQRKIRK